MKNTILKLILISLIGLPGCVASTPLSTLEPASETPSETTPGPGPIAQVTMTEAPEISSTQPLSVPSGLRVVYVRDGNLWSWTETDGSVQLTGTGDMSTARLSDDGQLLAFMRGREVWTVRMDGTDARLLLTLKDAGAALWFAPNAILLAVSTRDHIDLINLTDGTSTTVIAYPAISKDYYPEVIWSPDASGFKTVIPPQTESGQAELLFTFTDGTLASLAKFPMVPLSESTPYISPDGGYIIYVDRLDEKNESLYLMDSSGASKPYGEPMEDVRALGWLPDSVHFAYSGRSSASTYMGSIDGPPIVIPITLSTKIRWVDAGHYLSIENGTLILGDLNGGRISIDTGVQDYHYFLP